MMDLITNSLKSAKLVSSLKKYNLNASAVHEMLCNRKYYTLPIFTNYKGC